MAVQDLTPQLRTRLSRVERAVGWFVILATILLLAGFSYYIYQTAKRKGWFLDKVAYHTYLRDGAGLRVGDKVKLMGFDVGQITLIEGTEAGKNWFTENQYNVFVKFIINEPYYGYVWTDSKVRVGTGDFLGGRALEVTKGSTGEVSVVERAATPVRVISSKKFRPSGTIDYVPLEEQPNGFWLLAEEAPALTGRLDDIASRVEAAMPGILAMTNQLQGVLSNSARLTANLTETVGQMHPIITNLLVITSMLTNGQGALGEWLIPTNINTQLEETLAGANATLSTSETNIAMLAASLNKSLENLASITGNLNEQVRTNDAILGQVSSAIVQADQLMQGLKRHWLLRSAFKERPTNEPARRTRVRPPPPKAGKHRD